MDIFKITNNIEIPYINNDVDKFLFQSLSMVNPKWSENERLGRWNGKTPRKLKFYELIKGQNTDRLFIPRGFLDDLSYYCQSNNIQFKIERNHNKFKKENFKFKGQLRDYQKTATFDLLKYNEGVLCSGTGSGKTCMAIYMICTRKQPTIVLVHTRELLHQWIDRIKQFSNISDIGIIGGGKIEPKKITVALIQTLKKHTDLLKNFGYLIMDECHRIPCLTATDIVKKFNGSFITGLSATPFRRDGLTKVINFYCGPIRHKVETKKLQAEGHIVKAKPIIRETYFQTMFDPVSEYSKMLSEMSLDEERNHMIIEDVIMEMAFGETCLILSDRKIHCQIFYDILQSKGIKTAALLTGDTKSTKKNNKRQKIVDGINNGKINILIATSQLIGEGFDCKNLSCLFTTMPIRYYGRIMQYIGRVLRPKENKEFAKIYDYFDKNIPILFAGFKSRMNVYKKLS